MILRIVKLTFQTESIESFQEIFAGRREKIRHFEGCTQLELWQDRHDPRVFFTYSWWLSEAALDHYRHSEFFGVLWKSLKPMFAEKAEAWSVNVIRTNETVPGAKV
jgi:quinol monooxygenase YgiN